MATKTSKSEKGAVTMADLLAKAKNKVTSFTKGQRIVSRVVSISSDSVILDIGGKSEGIVKGKGYLDAKEYIATLKVGDSVNATILVPESRDGTIILALRDAMHDITWDRLEKLMGEEKEVAVLGKAVGASGLTVEVEGLIGFIPSSQIGKENSKNLQGLVGKYFKAKVVEIDKSQNKIVLSEKEVSEAEDIAKAKEAMKKVKEGDVYEGEVTTVSSFGAFVKFMVGKVSLEGLVHVSELSLSRVASPYDFVKVGDKVKVKVLAARNGKLALSMKQAIPDPWKDVANKFKVEDRVKGKIVRVSDFGMFVELAPGIEGLVHITKMPPTEKYEVGKEVNCVVEEIDSEGKKIALGLVLSVAPVGYK